jgi:hypothetical protein
VINDVGQGSLLEDRYDHEAVLAALRAASSHGRAALALFAYDGTGWW